ncbi:DUF72 domain-containing protein [Pseudomonas turukhanskensis]|uniref:DUF72 domain-containing protein n=1 Tax=Pseudomonas turukhanskensis TaxID=1806536 RepID=A0A9W6KAN3_9PSED|nr:DUF72 domain-containing protein [Pseudomonas turukhanskensis]GLK91188.1 hypothetical protein GCM10017655_42520 [Pseudomonas turukhanskensis]
MAAIRIGISGWRYGPWRGEFYPKGLVQKKELKFASRAVNSIEINGSFYALQTPERYRNWAADTPDDFVFSIKAPRLITHIKRLRDVEKPLANFFASGLGQLNGRLGPILWQFPPSFKFDAALIEDFFQQLPSSRRAAKRLASHSDERRQVEGYMDWPGQEPLRHAMEIRHDSFVDDAFVSLLREHNVALVIADAAKKWPYAEDLTSDFVYMRLHGDKKLYSSGYSAAALERWHERIDAWTHGKQPSDAHLISPDSKPTRGARDVYCYFDNDIKTRAPFDAHALLQSFDLTAALATRPGVLPQGIEL